MGRIRQKAKGRRHKGREDEEGRRNDRTKER